MLEKTTVRFNDCFLGKISLAKNLKMVFRGGGVLPTLLQDLCSTGNKNSDIDIYIDIDIDIKEESK